MADEILDREASRGRWYFRRDLKEALEGTTRRPRRVFQGKRRAGAEALGLGAHSQLVGNLEGRVWREAFAQNYPTRQAAPFRTSALSHLILP